ATQEFVAIFVSKKISAVSIGGLQREGRSNKRRRHIKALERNPLTTPTIARESHDWCRHIRRGCALVTACNQAPYHGEPAGSHLDIQAQLVNGFADDSPGTEDGDFCGCRDATAGAE